MSIVWIRLRSTLNRGNRVLEGTWVGAVFKVGRMLSELAGYGTNCKNWITFTCMCSIAGVVTTNFSTVKVVNSRNCNSAEGMIALLEELY